MEREAFRNMNSAQAVEEMMHLYGDQLLRLCAMYLKDVHEAQDAVQETFIKAYRSWPGFRHDSSELTWLVRIAVRTCRDMRRKTWFKIADLRVPVEGMRAKPEKDLLDGDVTQAVMALGEKYRLPILLHYYQGLPVKDVALILDLPQSTALTRLKRGRDQLREKLTEGGDLR